MPPVADITPAAGLRQVAVLGATGSIGASALDVIARHPDRYRASVLAGGHRVDALLDLCRAHRPEHAVIADAAAFCELREGLRADFVVLDHNPLQVAPQQLSTLKVLSTWVDAQPVYQAE